MQYPYDDDYMVFNPRTQRYVLTEKALLDDGVDLRARFSATGAVTPEASVNKILRTGSDMIYNYIHVNTGDNMRVDRFIATLPSLRNIIYNALLYQTEYVATVGNLYLSTDEKEREKAMDKLALGWLQEDVPELGRSILYAGV